jgi:hypothetical protein
MSLTESLHANDLRDMVKPVFEIDSFKSKIGRDEDIVVLSFTVDQEDPAKDLENFFEMGYSFVLDADVSPGETDNGTYRVYVELERTRHAVEQIFELIQGVKKLTGLDDLRFRYFKSFKSKPTTIENLQLDVPVDKESYNTATEKRRLDNFSEFFSNSYAEELKLINESITFKRAFSGPVTFEVINSGNKKEIYDSVKGPIVLESKDMAEVMFLTKVIGNYNITKIGKTFIFENNGWAVALKRIQ